MGVTTRRNTSENHNKKRRNHNKKCRKQDSKLRNQNGKLKSTPLKPLTLQNRYARAFCASENINKHLQEHQKDYVVTSLKLLRVRGSTIFETFKAQNAEICTPPRPCPPRPGPQRGQSTDAGEHDFRDFQGSKRRNLYSPRPCPPRPGPQRGQSTDAGEYENAGQSTGAGEYDFRDFQASKRRNLYSPTPCPPAPWTPERPEHRRGGSTIFETFKAQNAEICTGA